MNILIVGNLGYVGFILSEFLKKNLKFCTIHGFDNNYFDLKIDQNVDKQYFGDVRQFNESILNEIDIVIYLAAISNDPMGNTYEEPTMEINCFSAFKIAKISKTFNIKHFIYASSCSVYGFDDGNLKTEKSEVNPLIHLKDMSRAILWATERDINNGGSFLTVNVGSNNMNFKIIELAMNIKKKISDIDVNVNHEANDDKRSYQVDFSVFNNLAKNYLPKFDLDLTINDLIQNLVKIENLSNFRESNFIRLNVLNNLVKNNKLNKKLEWI